MYSCFSSLLLLTILVFLTNGIAQNWSKEEPIHADSVNVMGYTAYTPDGNGTIIAMVRMQDDTVFVELTTQIKTSEFQIPHADGYFSRLRSFNLGRDFYVYLRSLYSMNPDSVAVNKTDLLRNDYRYINVIHQNTDMRLIASSGELIDIYRMPGFKPVQQIKRAEYLQFDIPLIVRKNLIYRNHANELCVYDLQSRKPVHFFNSGTQTASFLGIPVGSFEDKISWYQIANGQLYFTTYSGAIYKADLASGRIIDRVERFRGEENNAGLITWFALHDFNSDGQADLVGPSVDENIYCINGRDLSMLWRHDAEYEIQMPLSLYDITGDEIPEVFGVTDDMNLWILDGRTGEVLFHHRISKQLHQTSVGILDLDFDEKPEILLQSNANTLEIWQYDSLQVNKGEILWLPLF